MLNAILIATLIIAAIGAVAAIALAVADKYLAVQEDPRIGLITAALPGANCGGCGFAGCGDYARALVQGTASVGACAPGGNDVNSEIAKILGVTAEATEKRVAIVHCCGSRSDAIRVGDYNGICDCASAAATSGGDKGCRFGCLGYGACANVCPQHAIRIEDGLAIVDKKLCIGCGKCVNVCPRKLIELVPESATIHVLCNNPLRGPAVRKVCSVGCMGCHICEKIAGIDSGSFKFNGFLAQIDYAHAPTNQEIVAKCPAHCIRNDADASSGH